MNLISMENYFSTLRNDFNEFSKETYNEITK